MSEQAPSSGRGWVVTFAGTGINLVLGVLYAWSVTKSSLVKDWGWSNYDANLPFAISTATFALTMIFAGRLQDRIGPKRVAIAGGVLLGLGMLGAAFASTPTTMLLTFGILGGIGIGVGYSATTPPALKWFPSTRKGLISGIVVAGVGLAAVYMSPLTQYLHRILNPKLDPPSALASMLPAHTAIGNTFFVLGIGTIVVISLLSLLLINPPAGYIPGGVRSAGSGPAKSGRGPDMNWNEMIKTPQFYGLWLMYILSAAPGLMLLANAKDIGIDQAQGWKGAVQMVMVMSIFNTIGRVVAGFVSDRIGRQSTMMIAFLLQAVNMVLFAHYTTPNMLLVGSGAAGLFYGSFFALMPAVAADFYGLKNMGVNYGMIFTGFGVAGVLGSLLGGKVKDVFHTYHTAYLIFAGMLVVSAVLALLTRTPRSKAQQLAQEPVAAGTK